MRSYKLVCELISRLWSFEGDVCDGCLRLERDGGAIVLDYDSL